MDGLHVDGTPANAGKSLPPISMVVVVVMVAVVVFFDMADALSGTLIPMRTPAGAGEGGDVLYADPKVATPGAKYFCCRCATDVCACICACICACAWGRGRRRCAACGWEPNGARVPREGVVVVLISLAATGAGTGAGAGAGVVLVPMVLLL